MRLSCHCPVEHGPLTFTPQTLDSPLLPWAFQTEKELDPDGLKKESERDRAMLALTSTLNKLIKRLEEKQSPELVKKHRKRRVVPKKPPPSPQTAGKSCQTGRGNQAHCLCPSACGLWRASCSFPSEGAYSLPSFWNTVFTPAFARPLSLCLVTSYSFIVLGSSF